VGGDGLLEDLTRFDLFFILNLISDEGFDFGFMLLFGD
jgi:hypothetical protein